MRYMTMIALCAGALFADQAAAQEGGGGALSASKQTLAQFLASCDAGDAQCRDDLKYGFETAADDMAFICPPDNLSEADAAEQELTWLHSAASDPTVAAKDEVDVEFDALNALWPCAEK